MSWIARTIIGTAAFGVVFFVGWFAFGIHPTLAEALLVSLAIGVSNGVDEGLR